MTFDLKINMPQTGLNGPFSLTNISIDSVIKYISPGAYALGQVKNNTFYIEYIGRSDENLNARLKQWVGKNGYSFFKYGYLKSEKEAFEKECNLYHDFSGLDNSIHPQRPAGTYLQCPRGYCLN